MSNVVAPADIHWYHTFDLPSGTTQGLFDLRPVVSRIPLPADLTGSRCLDAAASDGFWGFELARRGATEVVSLDLGDSSQQDYQHRGRAVAGQEFSDRASMAFAAAKEALGVDTIRRVDMSVYDASPETLGTFDYVFLGNILLHLSDPVRALAAMRAVLDAGGEFLSLEPISLALTALTRRRPVATLFVSDRVESHRNDFNRFWLPNAACHTAMVRAGGFDVLDSGGPVYQPVGDWRPRRPERLPRTLRELHYWAIVRRRGLPSHWVRARPE